MSPPTSTSQRGHSPTGQPARSPAVAPTEKAIVQLRVRNRRFNVEGVAGMTVGDALAAIGLPRTAMSSHRTSRLFPSDLICSLSSHITVDGRGLAGMQSNTDKAVLKAPTTTTTKNNMPIGWMPPTQDVARHFDEIVFPVIISALAGKKWDAAYFIKGKWGSAVDSDIRSRLSDEEKILLGRWHKTLKHSLVSADSPISTFMEMYDQFSTESAVDCNPLLDFAAENYGFLLEHDWTVQATPSRVIAPGAWSPPLVRFYTPSRTCRYFRTIV